MSRLKDGIRPSPCLPTRRFPLSTFAKVRRARRHHGIALLILAAMTMLVTLQSLLPCVQAQSTVLSPAGATWKYLDNGTNQGTAWRAASFNDSTWASGPAQLGYGDGDEATVLGYGPDPNNKYITTYFRRSFSVANPSAYASLTLNLKRDDSAAVYLNGVEVFRTNLAASAAYNVYGSNAADDGNTWQTTTVAPSLLAVGNNVLAVEIHQATASSSDISFDLELTAKLQGGAPVVTRGPYLQIGTPTGGIVRWRTDLPSDSRVRYGPGPDNLTLFADQLTSTTEHEVTLSGLTPNTTYYYSIGSTTTTQAGADANHFFKTSPAEGSSRPTRIWVIGDAGTGGSSQTAVKNAYLNHAGTTYTDLFLMLGDNAYEVGLDSEYQTAVFEMYPTILRQSFVWPTLGNHDAYTSPPPYFNIFTLPTTGQAGGLASGTENYYSFNFGNIHFVCLDSMSSDRSVGGPMLTWLQNDLAANNKPWLIAYWHHPPYTKGSHDSDTETELAQMRANALPILENFGVDLVLSGHSHSYERSFLIDSHYGASSTFNSSMKKNGGDGRRSGNGAYSKPTAGLGSHEGAVYVVAGSSGKISGGSLNHPAMFVSLNNLGSMVLDVNDLQLDAKFLRETGAIDDSFTIIKGSTSNASPTVSITSPTSGATFTAPANITINATAADSDGRISQVEFYQGTTLIRSDRTAPYSASWSNVTVGSYALTAKATDNAGAVTTSSVVTITVNPVPNAPPTVSLTNPTNGATFTSPANIAINATAADSDGTVSQVQFYQGTTLIATVTTAPYAITWNNVAAGTYSLTAKATDNAGATTTSSPVSLTVSAAAPPAAPGNLTATSLSRNRIRLDWTDNSSNETGFKIERSTNGVDFTQIATVTANIVTYTNSNLTMNTLYYYRVRSYNTSGDSPSSNTTSARAQR